MGHFDCDRKDIVSGTPVTVGGRRAARLNDQLNRDNEEQLINFCISPLANFEFDGFGKAVKLSPKLTYCRVPVIDVLIVFVGLTLSSELSQPMSVSNANRVESFDFIV